MYIQTWLRNNDGDLELLKTQLGISTVCHEDGRTIFNYSQIDSPKQHPAVLECRGLVLDSRNDWELVARAFPRFFNTQEYPDKLKEFDWKNCLGYHKEDGSLLLCYYWNGSWYFNTRASFCDCPINDFMTWRDLVLKAIPKRFFDQARSKITYVFELCSLYNKVVRTYNEPQVFLLTIYDHKGNEWENDTVEVEARWLELQRPLVRSFTSIEEVEEHIRQKAENDPTFEGIVLRDRNNYRVKVKSPVYLAPHRMSNNGNPGSAKNLIPFIVSNELDELYAYFEETRPFVEEMQKKIDKVWKEIDNLWFCYHDEPSQKRFAMAVKDSPYSGILFQARKLNVEPWSLFWTTDYLLRLFK
jgi:hypothetical protein